MSKEISITNIRMINKGSLILQCDVEVKSWCEGIILKDIRYFKNHNGHWIKMPSTSWVADNNETRFKQLVLFCDQDDGESFKNSVCDEIKIELSNASPVATKSTEIPF